MSEQSNRFLWTCLLGSIIGVFILGLFLLGAAYVAWLAFMPDDHRAARELRHRGFHVIYNWRDSVIPRLDPTHVGGNPITPEDSRLISRLPRLHELSNWTLGPIGSKSDVSGLDLDEIGKNCRELTWFRFSAVEHFPPISDIRKLATCPIKTFVLEGEIPLSDSDLEVFAGFTKLEALHLKCNSAGITDAGLEHLEHLPSLQHLFLPNTSITAAGVEAFRQKRPDVIIALE